jgi:hypothetical protein
MNYATGAEYNPSPQENFPCAATQSLAAFSVRFLQNLLGDAHDAVADVFALLLKIL